MIYFFVQTCLEKKKNFSVFCNVLREMENLACKEKGELEDMATVDGIHYEQEVET